MSDPVELVNPVAVPEGPPVPSSATPEVEFDPAYEAFNGWERDTLRPGMNALAAGAFVNAGQARIAAGAAATEAAASLAARDLAVAAAQAAVNSPGSMATSTTSLAVGSGDKVFTLVEAGKDFSPGQFVVAANTANPTTVYMTGMVKAYDKPTRLLTLNATTASGAGSYSAWNISVSAGPQGVTRIAYANRGTLRSTVPIEAASMLVEGLGLFSYAGGSTEIDDDETCFATGGGRWLLEAASVELVDSWLKNQLDVIASDAGRVLTGYINNVVLTVTNAPVVLGVAFVSGAIAGDRILVTPPTVLTSGGQPVLSGAVTAPNIVTVYGSWPSASGTANVPVGIYKVTVFKEF